MGCVQNAPPEDPDPLPPGIEERNDRPPPLLIAFRQELKSRRGQLQHPLVEALDRKPRRQDLLGRDFRRAEEFGEESALRKPLVLHDIGNGTGAGMRAVVKIGVSKVRPDGNHFVRLAGVVPCPKKITLWDIVLTSERRFWGARR